MKRILRVPIVQVSATKSTLNKNFSSKSSECHSGATRIVDILFSLESELKYRNCSKPDSIFLLLQQLNDKGVSIPSSYYYDTIAILARRSDIRRTEILLQIARENTLGAVCNGFAKKSNYYFSLLEELSAFAITKFAKESSVENSMKLWRQLSKHGIRKESILISKIVNSIGRGQRAVNIDFLQQADYVMKSEIWHHSPRYNLSMLSAISRYFNRSSEEWMVHGRGADLFLSLCRSMDLLPVAEPRMIALQEAMRIRCLVALARSSSKISTEIRGKTGYDEAILRFHNLLSCLERDNQHLLFKNSGIDHDDYKSVNIMLDIMASSLKERKMFGIASGFADRFCNVEYNATIVPSDFSVLDMGLDRNVIGNSSRRAILNLLIGLSSTGELDTVVRLLKAYVGMHDKLQKSLDHKQTDFLNSNDFIWLKDTVSQIIENARFRANDISSSDPENDIEKKLSSFIQLITSVSVGNPNDFVPAHVSALFSNIRVLSSTIDYDFHEKLAYRQVALVVTWKNCLDISYQLIGDCNKPVVYHALIVSLCSLRNADSFAKARSIIVEMDSKSILPLPESWALLVKTAAAIAHDSDVSQIVDIVERRYCYFPINASNSITNHPSLLEALFAANARLAKGLKSLELIKIMRKKELVVPISFYFSTVNALAHSLPSSSEEWKIVMHPLYTSEWLLREMHNDGLRADETFFKCLLQLFSKNCQIANSRSSGEKESVDAMQCFIDSITNEDFLNHPRIKKSEELFSNLIKGACKAGLHERAAEIAESSELLYNIQPSALTYEPLLYHHSIVRLDMESSERILTMMLNKKIKFSVSIVDAAIIGFLRYSGDYSEALDRIQDTFNQHNVAPSPSVVLEVLDNSLKQGDIFEARRAVVVIKQLYPNLFCGDPLTFCVRRNDNFYLSSTRNDELTSSLLTEIALKKRFQSFDLSLDQ